MVMFLGRKIYHIVLQSTDSAFKGIGYGDQPPPLPIFFQSEEQEKDRKKRERSMIAIFYFFQNVEIIPVS